MEEQSVDDGIETSPFMARPNYRVENGRYSIRDYGDHFFFPQKRLQKGLKEVIIFTENQEKRHIPNGSVWVYDADSAYVPEILREDVGCGITGYIIPKIGYDAKFAKDVLKVINEENIKIGRGNHFIDFTLHHPLNEEHNMVLLHSDFNFSSEFPQSYEAAQKLMTNAKEKRSETLEKLLQKLSIPAEFYNDWTHNSVEIKDGNAIYRKGAINLNETNYEGLLALNPFDGVFFYTGKFDNYHNSMQHGTGKKDAKKFSRKGLEIIRENGAEAIMRKPDFKPEDLYQHYNTEEQFNNKFYPERTSIGYTLPRIIIYTG